MRIEVKRYQSPWQHNVVLYVARAGADVYADTQFEYCGRGQRKATTDEDRTAYRIEVARILVALIHAREWVPTPEQARHERAMCIQNMQQALDADEHMQRSARHEVRFIERGAYALDTVMVDAEQELPPRADGNFMYTKMIVL